VGAVKAKARGAGTGRKGKGKGPIPTKRKASMKMIGGRKNEDEEIVSLSPGSESDWNET
jgi:hypothetical protein